ncbi:MAG: hypothetical protein ACREFJ_09660 [Acetobacteraceae bacterium]
MSDGRDDEGLRLCRHMHTRGSELCLRYTLSDGSYVGEINIACPGDAHAWQMLAYDLLAVTSAAADWRTPPEPGEERAAVHVA